jgi:hypothetical protein
VRKRFIASIAGGLAGSFLAAPLNSSLGFPPWVAMAGCSFGGAALGYVVSMLFDVFAQNADEGEVRSRQ